MTSIYEETNETPSKNAHLVVSQRLFSRARSCTKSRLYQTLQLIVNVVRPTTAGTYEFLRKCSK